MTEELPVTFVHMRVLLTSSDGGVLDASVRSPDSEEDHDETGGATLRARPGDRITYLYK